MNNKAKKSPDGLERRHIEYTFYIFLMRNIIIDRVYVR